MKNLLIIFSSSSDSEKLLHQLNTSSEVNADIYVFYDNYIPVSEFRESNRHKWFIQLGEEKSERVMNAFLKGFIKDYQHVLFWDSGINPFANEEINASFQLLQENDVVLGENEDVEIAVLGMNHLISDVFEQSFTPSKIRRALFGKELRFVEIPMIKRTVAKSRY